MNLEFNLLSYDFEELFVRWQKSIQEMYLVLELNYFILLLFISLPLLLGRSLFYDDNFVIYFLKKLKIVLMFYNSLWLILDRIFVLSTEYTSPRIL